jgi:FkbM family methyltransferase
MSVKRAHLRPILRARRVLAGSQGVQRMTDLMTMPLRTRDTTIRSGVGVGLRFNAAGANLGYVLGTTEPDVQNVLASHVRPGSTVYDIGANVGFFTVLLARLTGASGRIMAFEPAPEAVAALRHNLELNGFSHVVVMEAAVGAHDGTARLKVPELQVAARLVSEEVGGAISVPVLSLDAAAERCDLPAPSLVKIDAEGSEEDVLRGMSQLLARERPQVLCELHATAREVIPFLEEAGYQWSFVEPGILCGDEPWAVHVLAEPIDRAG